LDERVLRNSSSQHLAVFKIGIEYHAPRKDSVAGMSPAHTMEDFSRLGELSDFAEGSHPNLVLREIYPDCPSARGPFKTPRWIQADENSLLECP
jgi:hypothetical protein